MPRYLRQIVAGGLVAGVASCATAIWQWQNNPFAPLPPLAADLHGKVDDVDGEFKRRVRERFPVGSPEEQLIRELARQGFRPGWGRRGSGLAFVERFAVVCTMEWRVTWRADSAGLIAEINGLYGLTCL